MGNWILTSDTHFSDRPKDRYRFGLFDWLREQQEKNDVSATFILGDITENKDKHSSVLVNQLIDGFKKLWSPVYILRGNHDGNIPELPFFKFLNEIEGINFIVCPTVLEIDRSKVAFIPHCRTQAEFNEACKIIPKHCRAVLMHQTMEGALADNASGMRLSGLKASPAHFKGASGVWAGDIHKPQRLSIGGGMSIVYVGSPFQVRFGDNYTPRVLLIKND